MNRFPLCCLLENKTFLHALLLQLGDSLENEMCCIRLFFPTKTYLWETGRVSGLSIDWWVGVGLDLEKIEGTGDGYKPDDSGWVQFVKFETAGFWFACIFPTYIFSLSMKEHYETHCEQIGIRVIWVEQTLNPIHSRLELTLPSQFALVQKHSLLSVFTITLKSLVTVP